MGVWERMGNRYNRKEIVFRLDENGYRFKEIGPCHICTSHFLQDGYVSFPPTIYEKQKCLRKPEGRFYFAGEHTSEKFASMNGAIESGLFAAQQVLSSLAS